ncbi:MAG TPA: metalloregulator ArsR/SmtB family transcription factor [Actinomycetota bacterium]|nr:metalloregulator ArsR/SmtB family transcription factor [Actinomycetota bacterium]
MIIDEAGPQGRTGIRELEVLGEARARSGAPAECCTPLAARGMSEEDARTNAGVFKALADPHRVRILNILASSGEPACVCDLTPELGLSQPTVSFHLKKLVEAGLLHREQRGVWAFYSVDRDAVARLATVFHLEGARS